MEKREMQASDAVLVDGNDVTNDTTMRPTVVTTRAGPTSHQPTRGGDLIPRTKLSGKTAGAICFCALLGLASGSVATLLGVIIHGLMGKYATHTGPILWWAGLLPFCLGVLGFYAASSRSRRQTYVWGMGCLLVAVTQTALMGWVGNFTTSHYDVWPLHSIKNGEAVCKMRLNYCICQDYYHGVYSTLELPGVQYQYVNGVKWRRTVYDACGHLGAVTALYYAFQATWGLFLLASMVACIIGLAASVCAPQTSGVFQRLREERDVAETTTTEESNTTIYHDEPLQDIPQSDRPEAERHNDRNDTYDPGSILWTDTSDNTGLRY